ncbi:MAG: hypothetical protein RMJ59_04955 [Candidatus Nitrosocaldus sp.]|nr:hypothetical protein [Candidatus Nitrosocaldus sp.]
MDADGHLARVKGRFMENGYTIVECGRFFLAGNGRVSAVVGHDMEGIHGIAQAFNIHAMLLRDSQVWIVKEDEYGRLDAVRLEDMSAMYAERRLFKFLLAVDGQIM